MTGAGLKDIKQIVGLSPVGVKWKGRDASKREWREVNSRQYFTFEGMAVAGVIVES
jgi:hypothetical protein